MALQWPYSYSALQWEGPKPGTAEDAHGSKNSPHSQGPDLTDVCTPKCKCERTRIERDHFPKKIDQEASASGKDTSGGCLELGALGFSLMMATARLCPVVYSA